MAKNGMRIVKRPNLKPDQSLRTIRAELIKELEPVARQHVSQRQNIVSAWSNRPDFDSIIAVTPKRIRLEVFIKNASQSLGKYGGTVADLWHWSDLGTKPHTIVPRFKSVLRFVVGNVRDPRLGAGRFRNVRSGQIRSGESDVVYTKKVRHPGTSPQYHNRKINRRLRPALVKAISRGIRKGLRQTFKS